MFPSSAEWMLAENNVPRESGDIRSIVSVRGMEGTLLPSSIIFPTAVAMRSSSCHLSVT